MALHRYVLIETLLGTALADGLIADATIAQSEAQADGFWRIRESISDSERALGPASQHDISVPVAAMPRFMIDAAAACDARFPAHRQSRDRDEHEPHGEDQAADEAEEAERVRKRCLARDHLPPVDQRMRRISRVVTDRDDAVLRA